MCIRDRAHAKEAKDAKKISRKDAKNAKKNKTSLGNHERDGAFADGFDGEGEGFADVVGF